MAGAQLQRAQAATRGGKSPGIGMLLLLSVFPPATKSNMKAICAL